MITQEQRIAPVGIPVRASSAPCAIHCPASIRLGREATHRTSDASEQGTDLHALMHRAIQGERLDWDAMDPEDRKLVRRALSIWEQVQEWFDPFICEEQMEDEDGLVTGKVDLGSLPFEFVGALDWKFGRLDLDESWEQVKTYLYLLLLKWWGQHGDDRNPSMIFGVIAWPRIGGGEFETRHFTAQEIIEHGALLRQRAIEAAYPEAKIVRGPHCKWCKVADICPAARRDIALLPWDRSEEEIHALVASMTPEQVADTLALSTVAKRITEFVREAARAYVATHGPIPTTPGKAYQLLPKNRREIIVCDETRAVIRSRGLSDGDIDAASSISLTDLKAMVGERAPNRGKGAAQKALDDALAAANCFQDNPYLELRDAKVEAPALASDQTQEEK